MFHVKHSLEEGLKELEITPDKEKINGIALYIEELIRWNEKINLISRRLSQEEIVNKLILPSLIPHKIIHPGEKVLDFGAGAGIVGIPLKIVLPGITMHLVESRTKPTSFLHYIQGILNLDIKVIKKFVRKSGDLPLHYDSVLVRAVEMENIPSGIGERVIYYGEYKGKTLKLEFSLRFRDWQVSILSF